MPGRCQTPWREAAKPREEADDEREPRPAPPPPAAGGSEWVWGWERALQRVACRLTLAGCSHRSKPRVCGLVCVSHRMPSTQFTSVSISPPSNHWYAITQEKEAEGGAFSTQHISTRPFADSGTTMAGSSSSSSSSASRRGSSRQLALGCCVGLLGSMAVSLGWPVGGAPPQWLQLRGVRVRVGSSSVTYVLCTHRG